MRRLALSGTKWELPHRRVTFSTTNQPQDQQDPSQHSYYDSGLEESETPSSKSSSGPRIGPLALPEDHYERTTPDGSIGEMEHPENEMIRGWREGIQGDSLSFSLSYYVNLCTHAGHTYAICKHNYSQLQ
ncbi:hypothetical protein DPEC_G00018850 [Dallia pectoralis]|uniref:Uncharacterized protein n=1 Tax=Dallia pectoralis TaxID=75939 RepID=A0ACC2HFI0_DALPE|nr:hypothetical protein DPEC_G00018850 [Dallia pectoralis]